MKTLFHRIRLPLLVFAVIGVGPSTDASAATAYRLPRYANSTTYDAGNHKVRFIATMVRGVNFNRESLSAEARRIIQQAKISNPASHVWDDNWYQKFVPENGSEYLLLIAHDLTEQTHCWVAVQNSPIHWTVMDHRGNESHPGNGENVKVTRTYNGRRVDFDIRNPRNADQGHADHGLLNSDEDIYYSFGY